MASSAANSTSGIKLEVKLTSKQSRRSLHRPVSPYEREKSPVSPSMENNSLLDNSEIKSLLASVQELRHKKHILNPAFLIYLDACKIYSAVIKGYNPPRGFVSDIKDGETKLQICSLVFEAVQHVQVIRHWLEESDIYEKYFELHSHECLVELMAYDLQRRKFNLAPPHISNENVPSEVRAVSSVLWAHRTKLSASLARMRIEQNAQNIQQLLSERERHKWESWKNNPCYARITKPEVKDEVIAYLVASKLMQVEELTDSQPKSFCVQGTNKDVLSFSPDCREMLHSNSNQAVTSNQLVIQDLESVQFAECIGKMLSTSRGDIIITSLWSGVTMLHIASLTEHNVIVYGVTPLQSAQLEEKISELNLNNIFLVDQPFTEASAHDPLLEKVSVVLCTPISTLSAVNNPVDYLLQEGGDDIAALLLAPVGGCKISYKTMQVEQTAVLLHALKFSQASWVVYCTESALEEENGGIVKHAITSHSKTVREMKQDRTLRKFQSMPHIMRSFFSSNDSYCSDDDQVSSRYQVAVLEKEPLPPSTPPKDVIARAVASGLLSGIPADSNEKKSEKPKKKKKLRKPSFTRPTASSDAKTRVKSHAHHKKTRKRKPTQ